MKSLLRVIIPILWIIVITFQLTHIGVHYYGMDSPIWGLLLGFGLISSPFLAVGMLLIYILILLFIIGLPILGAYIGAQITGKDSIGVWVGLISGGFLGIKILMSYLLAPSRKVADQDDKESPP